MARGVEIHPRWGAEQMRQGRREALSLDPRTRKPNTHPEPTEERRDALALEKIGTVDMDKINSNAPGTREMNIIDALSELEELAENDGLSDWEYDFWESLNNQYIEGKTLSDKQYEKLLQIKVKYE